VNRIADYALIGDCHSLALVGRDGAIDWACFPRFDSPSVFGRILDAERGGHFTIAPVSPKPVRGTRRYIEDTNVLVTTFVTDTGEVEVTDCMAVSEDVRHLILRRVRCTRGAVTVGVEIAPRFEYATFIPRFRAASAMGGETVGGADALWVECTRPVTANELSFSGRWELAEGDEAWASAAWYPSHTQQEHPPVASGLFAELLKRTVDFWTGWMAGCAYQGEHAAEVRRSALVLKALTYAPSGAVIAAGTTSLPESIGGSRNWDYRYTWIRDATLTLMSLFILGFPAESAAFKWWLERSGAGRPEDLQIMYGICGERRLPELELTYLAGHRRSRPVRIGNGAASQTQLDSYGQILQSAYLFHRAGGELTADNWRYLAGLVDMACE
jgi:GH15 family glucan-1,4-alpha-glucosidase